MKPPDVKWRFAIGTTSIVPDTGNRLHYVIVDIDTTEPSELQLTLDFLTSLGMRDVVIQPTCRGYHIYTNRILRWRPLMRFLRHVPNIDHKWLDIGERRGYLYLADKSRVDLRWPVYRMVIYAQKRNTGRT